MNRDDIIRMAREAGLKVGPNIHGIWLVGTPFGDTIAHITIEEMERFAVQVAEQVRSAEWLLRRIEEAVKHEREECAKVCEAQSARWHTDQRDVYVAHECAAAIRARGNHD